MTNSLTLAERMNAGRLPFPEALRIAGSCAEQLRRMHEQFRIHGGLTPAAILLTESGVELQPAPPVAGPYTAPELLQGRPADERSDIFALGAILYEVFSGRRAFEGEDEASVAAAVANATPAHSGSVAVDRMVAGCLVKSPNARFQHVQKVQLELRLLASTARRGAPVPSATPAPPQPAAEAAAPPAPAPQMLRAPIPIAPEPVLAAAPPPNRMLGNYEIEALESRITARLQEQEKSVANVERVANEVLKALREGMNGGGVGRQASRGYTSMSSEPEVGLGRMDRTFELLNDKVSRIDLVLGNAVERMQRLETQLDAFDTDAAALRDSVTRDIRNFERALKTQSTAIESARTAMGQTDDLVERVVEALDSLQSMFMTSADERAAS